VIYDVIWHHRSSRAKAIGRAAIRHHGFLVIYREAHQLLEDLADGAVGSYRKILIEQLGKAQLLIIDDLGMRKLPPSGAKDLLELIMRRYERASTLITYNRLRAAVRKRFNAGRIVTRS